MDFFVSREKSVNFVTSLYIDKIQEGAYRYQSFMTIASRVSKLKDKDVLSHYAECEAKTMRSYLHTRTHRVIKLTSKSVKFKLIKCKLIIIYIYIYLN